MRTLRLFWLGPRAAGRGLIRLFTHDPATPWEPAAFYGPIAVACIVWNALGGTPAWAYLAYPLAGVLLWTFLEYVFHSVGFHWPTRSPTWRSIQAGHHGHHEAPKDPGRMVARLSFTAPIALGIYGLLGLALGLKEAGLVLVGLILGYLAYEVIHYWIHVGRGTRWILRPLVKHHLYHHYKDESRCFGVTSPLWDWVFRTGRVASPVARAPEASASVTPVEPR
jgi:sterol desaturase/sphingolipid hydroxylase (fatty acid hydroxylase superfamily)